VFPQKKQGGTASVGTDACFAGAQRRGQPAEKPPKPGKIKQTRMTAKTEDRGSTRVGWEEVKKKEAHNLSENHKNCRVKAGALRKKT